MLSKIKVADATPEQLREYLIQVCGLPLAHVPANTSEATLRSKLAQVFEGEEIVVSIADPQHQFANGGRPGVAQEEIDDTPFDLNKKPRYLAGVPTAQSGANDPKVTLTLTKTDDLERPCDVSVNGRRMIIPRGEPVVIPYRYFRAIQDAIRTVFDDDGNGGQKPRDVPAHPYAVNAMPSQREIAEWNFYMMGVQQGGEDQKAA